MSGPAVGQRAELEITVAPEQTAHVLGNQGVNVFATPFVITLLENVSSAVLRPFIPPGGGSVGTMVEMKHLAPTPVGMKVRASATVLESDGRRVLFQVEAFDEVEKIAEGRHERFIVPNLATFLTRTARKGRT
jgi:fluoroacetyl-CoA thioesterase